MKDWSSYPENGKEEKDKMWERTAGSGFACGWADAKRAPKLEFQQFQRVSNLEEVVVPNIHSDVTQPPPL